MELRTSEEGKQRRITFFYYAKIFSLYKKLWGRNSHRLFSSIIVMKLHFRHKHLVRWICDLYVSSFLSQRTIRMMNLIVLSITEFLDFVHRPKF
jgi:hypothetical protein